MGQRESKDEDSAIERGDALRPTDTDNARVWPRRILAAFVLFQLVTPLTYYLRSDPYDERFAWRMFSAIRLHRCETSAKETVNGAEQTIELDRVIHRAWSNTMSRNRRDVIHRFLEHRCAASGAETVRLENACRTPANAELAPQVYTRQCESGETTEP